MQNNLPMRGILTIPSTPFSESGEIDIPSFTRLVDFCVACGAHGLVYPVNASEFSTLSDEERLTLCQVLVEQNQGRIPVILGTAGVSAQVAARFAQQASQIGADGVIAMPPYVRLTGLPDQVIFEYYQILADAAQLPVFIQNYMPPIGTNMSAGFLHRLCSEIEYVQYIKEETIPSTFKLSEINHLNQDGSCLGVFGGAGGRYLIEEHRRGSAGNMPGCHLTDVVVAFWNALEAGDDQRAMHIYKEMAPMFFFEHQLPGMYKEVLYRRGVIACPLKRNGAMPMDETASNYLDEILKALEPLMTWGY